VWLGLWPATVHAQAGRHADVLEPSARLIAWLEDVQAHTPGSSDAAALEVARWSRTSLESLTLDIKKLSAFFYKARQDRARTLRIDNRTFTLDELKEKFLGNDTLLRGALLHSDIAMYVEDDVSRRDPERIFAVDDGRGQGTRHQTGHWRIGRLVLDAIAPAPIDEPGTLLWYRGTAAYLLREGHFAEARAHLERAAQLFPSSPDVLLDTAYVREKFASPEIQAAVQDYKSQGVALSVESEKIELGRAERSLRQTLALDPASVQARVRLGRVLGDLGRHQEAAAELHGAVAARPVGAVRYFAEMFLGREEQALGNRDNARIHFEAAAQLAPDAQSPYLALSQLARQSGDRPAALRALQHMISLPADELYRQDPWWTYYMFHADDVDELLNAARERAFGETQ
jgi:tetratricopeptide (TPR) repeat protein